MKEFENINYINSIERKGEFILINYELLEINDTQKSQIKKHLEQLLNDYLNKILAVINRKIIDVEKVDVEDYLANFKFDPKLNISQRDINIILGEEDYIVDEIIRKMANTNKRSFSLPLKLKKYEEYIVPCRIHRNNVNYLTLYIIIHFALIYSVCKEYMN